MMLWKLDDLYSFKTEDLDWEKFSSFWPMAGDKKPKHYWEVNEGPCRLTDEEVMGLVGMGIKVVPVPYPGAMIVKMQDRAKWDRDVPVTPEQLNNAQAIHISVADLGLLQIQSVTVLEDCCTDELQNWINDGWRILAVCPPNAARRPDYILGNVSKTADRGR